MHLLAKLEVKCVFQTFTAVDGAEELLCCMLPIDCMINIIIYSKYFISKLDNMGFDTADIYVFSLFLTCPFIFDYCVT